MRFEKIKNWYGKYERPISSASLIGGFVFDALTLKRVDLFWENVWVIGHIVIVGTCIVLIHALEREEGAEANPSKLHFWLVNIQQFFYGGIWSTFLVFYFRSSDIVASWPFLLILVLSFWANEALKRSFVRLGFQISLYYLSIFCFAIYLVPVITHRFGGWMFVLSGIISFIAIFLFLQIIKYFSKGKSRQENKMLFIAVGGVFALVNLLYFTNAIPPIPLSLKDAGIYYSLVANPDGGYFATGEQPNWRNYFNLYPNFHFLPGQPVFVYSAIFSPPKLNIKVEHEWQHLDAASGKWLTVDKIPLQVVGGRDGGFRTYSEKKFNLQPGKWRVNVLTTRGQVIGTIRFNLVESDILPTIIQKVN
jgi:hypothetical protein